MNKRIINGHRYLILKKYKINDIVNQRSEMTDFRYFLGYFLM